MTGETEIVNGLESTEIKPKKPPGNSTGKNAGDIDFDFKVAVKNMVTEMKFLRLEVGRVANVLEKLHDGDPSDDE